MVFRTMLAALMSILPALAEFRHITIGYSGEECSSCSASMTRALQRLRGVTAVSADAQKPAITIELAAGNRVPLSEIRDAIKRVGFTPGEARVVVRGTIKKEKDLSVLQPHGLEQPIELAGTVPSDGGDVELEGTIPPAPPQSRDTLFVKNSLSR
jgi:copper chaperone CopZ